MTNQNLSLPQLPERHEGRSEIAFTTSVFMPPVDPESPKVITNSLRNTYLDCSYKGYLEYERRLSPKISPTYFVWGGFLHFAMERATYGISIKDIQDELRETVKKQANEVSLSAKIIEQYEGYILLVPQVLDAYLLHYKDEWNLYEVIVAENKFSVALGDVEAGDQPGKGWTFQGKIDRIARNTETGVKYIWDMKTPGSTGPSFYIRLPLDSQLKGYVLGAQRGLGYGDILNAVYDVIQKPAKQDATQTDGDPQKWADFFGAKYLINHDTLFKRHIVEYRQEQIDNYYVELCMFAKELEWRRSEGIYVMHHPQNRFGGCPFYNICVYGEKSQFMQAFYTRDRRKFNNELAEE